MHFTLLIALKLKLKLSSITATPFDPMKNSEVDDVGARIR